MPILALVLVLILPLVVIAAMPLSIFLRYRASTARRQARGWVAAINVGALAVSVALFLTVAALTSLRAPRAFTYAVLGLVGGCVLGLLGLFLSRWEAGPRALHYTPSRALVFAITLVVASRMLYGLWRLWHAWRSTPGDASWLAASGVAGSLGAGAVVLGYYLAYNAGVWRRFQRHRRHALRAAP
jgi:hypothetical protein